MNVAGPAPGPAAAGDGDGEGLRRPASSAEVFQVFNRLAMQGFGGVVPIAHRELVERERWLSPVQFVEFLTLCQVLPGPNIINLSIILGDRFLGWRGALAATAGLLLLPMGVVLLAAGYRHHADVPAAADALRGMGAVAAGLVIATAVKLSRTLRQSPLGWPVCLGLGGGTTPMVGGLRWPMVGVVLGLGLVSITLAWSRLRQSQTGAGG